MYYLLTYIMLAIQCLHTYKIYSYSTVFSNLRLTTSPRKDIQPINLAPSISDWVLFLFFGKWYSNKISYYTNYDN